MTYLSSIIADGQGQETQKYKFSGKEFDTMHGLNQYDFHARQYDAARLQFTTPDPLAEASYSISPYTYCSNNPMGRIDENGQKDKPFNKKTDLPILEQINTRTPYIIKEKMSSFDKAKNKDVYNCHSFAWHDTKGDPTDPGNIGIIELYGLNRWDDNPADDIISQNYKQLSNDEPNEFGDRVIYYIDMNGDGKYDEGDEIVHSAVVTTVDKEGYSTTVISKMGASGTSINHPNAPGFYDNETSRAYFRNSKLPAITTVQSVALLYFWLDYYLYNQSQEIKEDMNKRYLRHE